MEPRELGTRRSVSVVGMCIVVLLSGIASAQTYAFNAAKFLTGHDPQGVVMFDFNRDGFADLAVVNYKDNTVSVLLGGGAGSLLPQVAYAVGPNPIAIAAGDFNRDGKPDLAVVNQNCPNVPPCPGPGSLSILQGNGDGTFQDQVTVTLGKAPNAIAVADFNHDGKVDIAAANKSKNTVSILLGKGDGTFQPQKTFSTGLAPTGIAAGDF